MIQIATLVCIDEGATGNKGERTYGKHMKGVDECSLPARTNGLVIDTHAERWILLHVCYSWVDCHQDEPLFEWQRVEPVAVRVKLFIDYLYLHC